jgi:hypothetical protein
MSAVISKKELSKVRKLIIGTHGFKNSLKKRAVVYYVVQISKNKFGVLWHAGLDLYDSAFLLNPTCSDFPFAFIGSRREAKEFAQTSINELLKEAGC